MGRETVKNHIFFVLREFRARTKIRAVDVQKRMTNLLGLSLSADWYSYRFGRSTIRQNTFYALGELLALIDACQVGELPHERLTAEEAFRIFSHARISHEDFKHLKSRFPADEYRDAYLSHAQFDALPDSDDAQAGFLKPAYPRVFIGREDDVAAIKRRLGIPDNRERRPMTIVRGLPGVGKTTLINHLVNDADGDIGRAFHNGILWTSLGPDGQVLNALKKWAREIGSVSVEALNDARDAADQIRRDLAGKETLLVADDIWSLEDGAIFKGLAVGKTTLLLTTRFTSIAKELSTSRADVYLLNPLNKQQSMDVLKAFAPNASAAYERHLHKLVRTLEGLPLALRVAGALIEYEHFLDFNVKQLISDLQENFRSLDSSDHIDEATGRTATIGMLFRRSILTLRRREQEAFACIGGFAPKPATVNLRAMTNLCGLAEPEKTVRILVGRGLLEPKGDGRFQMHSTLAMYARHLVDTELAELSS